MSTNETNNNGLEWSFEVSLRQSANELHLAVMVIPSSRSYSREAISETGFSFRLYQSPAAQLQILPE